MSKVKIIMRLSKIMLLALIFVGCSKEVIFSKQ